MYTSFSLSLAHSLSLSLSIYSSLSLFLSLAQSLSLDRIVGKVCMLGRPKAKLRSRAGREQRQRVSGLRVPALLAHREVGSRARVQGCWDKGAWYRASSVRAQDIGGSWSHLRVAALLAHSMLALHVNGGILYEKIIRLEYFWKCSLPHEFFHITSKEHDV